MLVVFGSLNTDLLFRVEKLPSPGETYLCSDYVTCAGGKGGNQALAAARAGAPVAMVGAVGDDDFGYTAQRLLKAAGVDLTYVRTVSRPTACASIYVDGSGENVIVVASGANLALRAAAVSDSLLTAETTVLIQMEVSLEENWQLLQRAHARGCKTLVNLAPAGPLPSSVWDKIDILVVNEHEARATLEALQMPAQDDPASNARHISEHCGFTCIITLGSRGSVAAGGGAVWRVLPLNIKSPERVIDTTGAGDAFVGVLGASLDGGASLPDALRRASAASGLACTKSGTQVSLPAHEAIDAALNRVPAAERF